MSSPRSLASRRRLAWAVPSATVAVVAGAAVVLGGVLPSSASADQHPDLAARTPAQLLAAVETAGETAATTALSGTVVSTTALGLPSLPSSSSSTALSLQSLVLGTHTARVWVDGPGRQRLALLGQLAETDVIHNGSDVWTYSSNTHQVGHATLPAEKAHTPSPQATAMTPQAVAEQAIAAIDPTTKVTVDRTQVVAGRPTYTLVLTPRDTASTVHQVLINVDSATSVPLRVQVYGTAGTPSVQVGFTDVSFSRPAGSVFAFTPPKGSTVGHIGLGATAGGPSAMPRGSASYSPLSGGTTADAQPAGEPIVHGSGWTAVLEIPGGSPVLDQVPSKILTALPNGDRMLSTTLVNALITPDGRLFVGAVRPQALQALAAGK